MDKKFDLQIESVHAMEFSEVQKSFADLADRQDLQLDPDLMYAKFIMCHEGDNANGDVFTNDVLARAQFTPRSKPIDWEHGQPIIGTILDSRYAEDANGRGYIEAIGVIWKFIYPDLADEIKAKASTGELRLSMECYFKDANYKYGDQVFDQEQAYQLGIADYVGREYMGQKVLRVFKDVVFGGVGVVANPADKEAVFLSVAKQQVENEINSSIETDEKFELTDEQIKVIADIIRTTNDFNIKQHSNEAVSAVTVAKFVKSFDSAKNQIVSNLNNEELMTKEQLVSAVKNIINSLLSEVSTITNDFYSGRASETEEEIEDLNMELKLHDSENNIEEVVDDMSNELNQTPEQVVETVVETPVVTETVQTVDYQAIASTLEAEVAELKAKLEAKASLEQELADLKAKVEAKEKKELAESRITELAELGVEFSEARKAKELEKVSSMDEASFSDYKEFLSELVAPKEVVAEVVEETVEEVVEEEVVVEQVQESQASLNIEIEAPKVIKPFSHLG